jgi:hypothetical protein
MWIFEYLAPSIVSSRTWRGVLGSTLCDEVCQRLHAGRWFSPVSSTNKTDRHDIPEILSTVAINTLTLQLFDFKIPWFNR